MGSIGRILIGIFLKKNGQDMLFWLFFLFLHGGSFVVLCRFMWIFCLLEGFRVRVGIFPCLVLKKSLKTALFAFGEKYVL